MLFPDSPITYITMNDIEEQLLTCKSWQEKYRQIMLIGKQLPRLPDAFQVESAKVHGCESNVWAYSRIDDGTITVFLDSDAKIVRGLLAIVLSYFQARKIQDVNVDDFTEYFERLELTKHLSPSRNNGIQAVSQQLLDAAAQNER